MTQQNRNVLITGGTGILGSAVTKAYLAQGDTVAVTYLFENEVGSFKEYNAQTHPCLLYTSPSPRDRTRSRMPSSA